MYEEHTVTLGKKITLLDSLTAQAFDILTFPPDGELSLDLLSGTLPLFLQILARNPTRPLFHNNE